MLRDFEEQRYGQGAKLRLTISGQPPLRIERIDVLKPASTERNEQLQQRFATALVYILVCHAARHRADTY